MGKKNFHETSGIVMVIAVALIIGLILAVQGAILAAVTHWGIIPLADAIWGVELPFWPVFLVTWLITAIVASVFTTSK